jgi:hypothetical protein
MKKEFYKAYEDLYSEYPYEQEFIHRRRYPFYANEYYITRQIRISIDKADKENTLRPDAKYYLLVNFHHLVVRPLFEQMYYREKYYKEIEQHIDADISKIVSETKQKTGKDEISGHDIMNTINTLWRQLRTTQFDFWG